MNICGSGIILRPNDQEELIHHICGWTAEEARSAVNSTTSSGLQPPGPETGRLWLGN